MKQEQTVIEVAEFQKKKFNMFEIGEQGVIMCVELSLDTIKFLKYQTKQRLIETMSKVDPRKDIKDQTVYFALINNLLEAVIDLELCINGHEEELIKMRSATEEFKQKKRNPLQGD